MLTSRSTERSLFSRGIVRTSDAEFSFASQMRKNLIALDVVLIAIALALLATACWMILPNSHRTDIARVQNSPFYFSAIIICLSFGFIYSIWATIGIITAAKAEKPLLLWFQFAFSLLLTVFSVFVFVVSISYANFMNIFLNIHMFDTLQQKYVSEVSKNDARYFLIKFN